MSKKTAIGRSDLLALAPVPTEPASPSLETRRKARLLGYEFKKPELEKTDESKSRKRDRGSGGSNETTQESAPGHLREIPFHYPIEIEFYPDEVSEPDSETVIRTSTNWESKPQTPPKFRHFPDSKLLEKKLRPFFAPYAKLRRLDTARTVKHLAEGRHLDRLPRIKKRKPSHSLQVVLDRSPHLIPFWNLQAEVAQCLFQQQVGRINFYFYEAGSGRILFENEDAVFFREPSPDEGPLMVLGDLGLYSGEFAARRSIWMALARSFAQSGSKPFLFFPGVYEALPLECKRLWNVMTPAGSGALRVTELALDSVEYLLTLASPASRLEPGLLSHLRQVLIPSTDVSLDIKAWCQSVVEQPSSIAATWSSSEIQKYRAKFARLPAEIQRKALAILRQWRWNLPDEIYYEELLNLPAAAKGNIEQDEDYREDFANARAYFEDVAQRLSAAEGQIGINLRAWLSRVGDRAGEAWQEEAVRKAVVEVKKQHDPNFIPPVDLAKVVRPGVDVGAVELRQTGEGIEIRVSGSSNRKAQGSPLSVMPTTNGVVEYNENSIFDRLRAVDFWEGGRPPAWVDDWGFDEYGAWAVFTLELEWPMSFSNGDGTYTNIESSVVQKMRWISPGRFKMGSPSDEPGRNDDEGPEFLVTIGRGFWLFDTPVTQGLWRAVMDESPSEFEDAERPVENVSWNDAKGFIERLNKLKPGLSLDLPSEAEWEYACRAGSYEATYAGPLSIMDDKADHAVLDRITWYRENSGDETHPVGKKEPNEFGLYDMLGNVFEWCADEWHSSYDGAPADGSAWRGQASELNSEGRASRVVRGGSWHDVARFMRSAYRLRFDPSGRYDDLGFRCVARSGELKPEVWSTKTSLVRPQTRVQSRMEQDGAFSDVFVLGKNEMLPSKPKRAAVDQNTLSATISLNGLPTRHIQILTDRAKLTLEPMTKPSWASAIGRDRFGLYADLTVENVTQKLRWIPPGRFLMGAPEDEPGRYYDEGPQHIVTIGAGFWLFDTPVTQNLWQALMEENPSEFVHPKRPVENVSWDDAKGFIKQLNKRLSGLAFDLPSEAEWEYACRAGTTEATYAGPMTILGANNAPVLDEISWYGGNSGQDFDLEDRYDRPSGQGTQYPKDHQAGTKFVAQKKPNSFGLYDMLGNVWEWCADHWNETYEGSPINGGAWINAIDWKDKDSTRRVIRGGSWDDGARDVRSASRSGGDPSNRRDFLGFRCTAKQADISTNKQYLGEQVKPVDQVLLSEEQTTLAEEVTLTGIGVHSGKPASITLVPADAGTGVIFQRIDTEDAAEIPALWNRVTQTSLQVVLGDPSDNGMSTVEHLMAALVGMGVDNLIVEIDGPEMPIMDGSSAAFVDAIEHVGLKKQGRKRRYLKINKPIRVDNGSAWCELTPYEGTRFEITIDFDTPLIGRQTFASDLTPQVFRDDLSRARTFGYVKDVEQLWKMGFALGSSLENSVAIAEDKVLNPEGTRWPDEFVRHKAIDAMGDLALAGLPILGLFRSYKGGHKMNNAILVKLFEDKSAYEIVEVRDFRVV